MTASRSGVKPSITSCGPHNKTQERVIDLLARYFCLSVRDTAALLRGRTPTQSDERSLRRTLSLLHRDGFVERLPHLPYGRERGGCMHVYGLSDKCVRYARREGFATAATKTLDDHSIRTLDHELEITAFHMALNRMTTHKGLAYDWRQADLKRTIHPDALITIRIPDRPDEPGRYFLEVERSKFGHYQNGEPQILRKLAAYYAQFNATDCEKEWGFRRFRVIVVQRTEARREGLLAALSKKFPHRMFWLTTEAAVHENIGGEIFKTPKDYAERSYSILGQTVPEA